MPRIDYLKARKHYIFYIFGIKFSFKRKNYYIERLCLQIQRKLSAPDSIYRINNTKFYLPNYPIDLIQSIIVDNKEFFTQQQLEYIKKYIPRENAVICDIGANIGNHSLYWANLCNAKKIYAFEPIDTTYNILLKNIEINNLQNIIIPFNIGLSSENSYGIISEYSDSNIGATNIEACQKKSDIKLKKLDDINIEEDKIDLIKIDVEGHEYYVLKGMENTLRKYRPFIFIEIFPNKYDKVNTLLKEYNYEKREALNQTDYIYQYKGN